LESLSEKNVLKAVQNPFSIISSNGVGYSIDHKETGELVHPRNFGTFPKVFAEYVRKQKVLSWEEAVHKMSGKPAMKFKLQKRGLLQEGYFADIVVFQPEIISDRSTMEDPYQYAIGISHITINGFLVMEEGQLLSQRRYGHVLRREKGWFEW
jgi:N-acyl-D-aspartate/D-glutamate deacylase